MKKKGNIIIVQARQTSKRFPNKVLKKCTNFLHKLFITKKIKGIKSNNFKK